MRQPGTPQAIATFAIPPHAPPAVAEAKVKFDDIAARWANTKGELGDAVEALEAAKQADLRAIVNSARQGKDVKDPQANQRKAEALIADLRFLLKGLDQAVDKAGNRLAQAITTHRKQWLPRLADAETDAAERFDQAVIEARAALDELRPARGAVKWLNSFDPDLARMGQGTQFSGGRLRVRSNAGPLRGDHDPTALIDLAAKVTSEEDVPRPTVSIPVPKVASHA
jgi:hypothetical protein